MPTGVMVEVPGAKLLVRDTGGSGMPVVMLHANTGTSESWVRQYAAFARAGYRVVAFDRRGWGGSVADPESGEQPGSVAGDLDALVVALRLPRFGLVAVAGGGFVALDYLAWQPKRVRCAVIAASSGLLSDPEFVAFSKRITIPALNAGPAANLELGASYRGSDPEGVARWSVVEARSRRPGAPDQLLRTPNTMEKLGQIATPVLVIAADADLLAPPALMRMWAGRLQNKEWAIVEEAGHSLAWEKPEAFNQLALRYLGRRCR